MNRFVLTFAFAALAGSALVSTAEAKSRPLCYYGYAYVQGEGNPLACTKNYKQSPSWLSQGRFQYQEDDGKGGWKMVVLIDPKFRKTYAVASSK